MYRLSRNKRKFSPTPIVRVEVVKGKEVETPVLYAPLMDSEGSFFDKHRATEKFLQEIVDMLNHKEWINENVTF